MTARLYHNDAGCLLGQGRAERGDCGTYGVVAQAEVDDENLVLGVVDDVGEVALEPDAFDGGEHAVEDRVLPGLAVGFGHPVDASQAFGIRDVVAEEVCASHERWS